MSLVIFNRKVGMKLEVISQGVLTANGNQQTLVEDADLSTLSGFVDLSAMEAGDTVVIRQYVDLNGGYKLYAEESYSNVQIQPAVCITPKGSNTQMKVTIQQTAGVYRQFGYEFIREV